MRCRTFLVGQDQSYVVEFGALALVRRHGHGERDIRAQGLELENGKPFIQEKTGHPSGVLVIGGYPQNEALVAVEEASLLVVAEHHDGLADVEASSLRRHPALCWG